MTRKGASGFSFTSDAGGEVQGSFREWENDITEPPFDFAEQCPKGHTLARESVTYFRLLLVDQTHGISQEIPGTFTYSLR